MNEEIMEAHLAKWQKSDEAADVFEALEVFM